MEKVKYRPNCKSSDNSKVKARRLHLKDGVELSVLDAKPDVRLPLRALFPFTRAHVPS